MALLKQNEYIVIIKQKLADPKDIEAKVYEDVVLEAVAKYSQYRPQVKVEDVAGDGGFLYTLPSDWINEFSSIVQIVYPYDDTDQIPNVLKTQNYMISREDGISVLKLRFLSSSPNDTEEYRLVYTLPHTMTTASTTVPEVDQRAVVNYACGLFAEILAAEYEKKGPTTMPDLQFDLNSKAREYWRQADRYYTLWREAMGISKDGSPSASSVWIDTDWALSTQGPPLTHYQP